MGVLSCTVPQLFLALYVASYSLHAIDDQFAHERRVGDEVFNSIDLTGSIRKL